MSINELVSLIGILVALGVLMYLIMRGINIFVIAFISAAIVGVS